VFHRVEKFVGKVRSVFKVAEVVRAEIVSQPVESKTLAIIKKAANITEIPGNKPVENFIYLFLREF